MNKYLKYVFLAIFILIIGFSLFIQIRFENYIYFQKKEYNLLQDRRRISYKPTVIYLVFSNNKDLNKRSLDLLRYDSKVKKFKSNYLKDEYILECYYTKKEKENFLSDDLKSRSTSLESRQEQ